VRPAFVAEPVLACKSAPSGSDIEVVLEQHFRVTRGGGYVSVKACAREMSYSFQVHVPRVRQFEPSAPIAIIIPAMFRPVNELVDCRICNATRRLAGQHSPQKLGTLS
jgi:hypothetical protein